VDPAASPARIDLAPDDTENNVASHGEGNGFHGNEKSSATEAQDGTHQVWRSSATPS